MSEYFILTMVSMLFGFITVSWLVFSNKKFLEGEIKKIFNSIILGIAFIYYAIVIQTIIEYFGMYGSRLEVVKYSLILIGFLIFFWSAYRMHKTSKILGFASGKMPKKLEKILKE